VALLLGLALALPGILDVRRGVDARELAATALAASAWDDPLGHQRILRP